MRTIQLLGALLFILGLVFLINSYSGITGFTILNDITEKSSSLVGIVLIVGGVVLYIRGEVTSLENRLEGVLISTKALEKREKDHTIRAKWGAYLDEIERIRASPEERPKERIGEFLVSPRGHKQIRVAWHYDKANDIVYVDDFLYHTGQKAYSGDWNRKATDKKITRSDYKGYRELRKAA